jgi:hypothetical protein
VGKQAARGVAADELTREGVRVRFGGTIHVPEDEICFVVFDAASSRNAALAATRAELDPLRIVEAVTSQKAGGHHERGGRSEAIRNCGRPS